MSITDKGTGMYSITASILIPVLLLFDSRFLSYAFDVI